MFGLMACPLAMLGNSRTDTDPNCQKKCKPSETEGSELDEGHLPDPLAFRTKQALDEFLAGLQSTKASEDDKWLREEAERLQAKK